MCTCITIKICISNPSQSHFTKLRMMIWQRSARELVNILWVATNYLARNRMAWIYPEKLLVSIISPNTISGRQQASQAKLTQKGSTFSNCAYPCTFCMYILYSSYLYILVSKLNKVLFSSKYWLQKCCFTRRSKLIMDKQVVRLHQSNVSIKMAQLV